MKALLTVLILWIIGFVSAAAFLCSMIVWSIGTHPLAEVIADSDYEDERE